MLEAYLFRLGHVNHIDLERVAGLINRSQKEIKITVDHGVVDIGNPDLGYSQYSRNRLLAAFPATFHADICIGLTEAPLQGNFYTLTEGARFIIITMFQTAEICQKAGLESEEYIAQTIATAFLLLQYRHYKPDAHFMDLYHRETRGCIFDLAEYKPDLLRKLTTGEIEPSCRENLEHTGVPACMIDAAERIIAYAQKPPVRETFSRSLERPLFGFVFGSLVGGLFINVLSTLVLGGFDTASDALVIVILVVAAIGLLLWNHFSYRRSRHSRRHDTP